MTDPNKEDETDKTVPDQDETSAKPSDAQEAEPERSMLDAVKDAIKPQDPDGSDTPDQPKQETERTSDEGDDKASASDKADADPAGDDDLTDEEMAQLSRRTQKRIKGLVADNKGLQSEIDQLRPKADAIEKLRGYMADNRLAREEVDQAFQVASLVKNDPVRALPVLEALVKDIRQMVGAELPPDLSEQVRLGYITQPAADELSRGRAERTMRDRQDAERSAEMQERQRLSDFQQAVDTSVATVEAWYRSKAENDPEFQRKQGRIAELAELHMLRTNRVPTRDETVKLLDDLYDRVTKEDRTIRPQLRANDPVDGSASPAARPKPNSMLEAMEQALEAGAG